MRLIDKIKKMGSLLILSTCCLTSCNFLDVVPPEQAGLGDAVKKPESTLGFLYSCYAGIKGSSNPITYTEWKLHLLMNLYSRNYGDTADSVPVGDC